jgi:hypothetical protein
MLTVLAIIVHVEITAPGQIADAVVTAVNNKNKGPALRLVRWTGFFV